MTAAAGHRYSETIVPGPSDSAQRWGNTGLDVLSTPAIVGHMETVCVRMLATHLPPDTMTVGTAIEMRHLAPVRVGEPVDIEVATPEIGGRMTFQFRVTDAQGQVVAKGSHRRAMVETKQFLDRLRAADRG